MMERRKQDRDRGARRPGLFDGGGPGTLADREAVVAHGPYSERLPVADMTVGEIRARFSDRFDIPPNALAMVGADVVGDDVVLRAGEMLTFAHRAGEKGAHG